MVGQDFTEDYFFHGRVSAVNYNTYTEEQKKMENTVELHQEVLIMEIRIQSWKNEWRKI